MGCSGCKGKVSGAFVGRVKMRFVGKPNGILMKGAPGAPYQHGVVYDVPAKFGQWKFWEPVESPPEIRAPEAKREDSVFGDEVFIPPEAFQTSTEPVPVVTPSIQVGELTESKPEVVEDKPESKDELLSELKVEEKQPEPSIEEDENSEEKELDESDPDYLPPEMRAELESLGDGIVGEQPKTRRKRKTRDE